MDKIDEVLTRGVSQILPTKEGLAKLMAKKKITLYQGFDPTGTQLHIGHAVALRKLRQFQDLAHGLSLRAHAGRLFFSDGKLHKFPSSQIFRQLPLLFHFQEAPFFLPAGRMISL